MSSKQEPHRCDAHILTGLDPRRPGFGQSEDLALISFIVEEGHRFGSKPTAAGARMAEAFRDRFPEAKYRFSSKVVENRLLHIKNHIASYVMSPDKRTALAKNLGFPVECNGKPGGGSSLYDKLVAAGRKGSGSSSGQSSQLGNPDGPSCSSNFIKPASSSTGQALSPSFQSTPLTVPAGGATTAVHSVPPVVQSSVQFRPIPVHFHEATQVPYPSLGQTLHQNFQSTPSAFPICGTATVFRSTPSVVQSNVQLNSIPVHCHEVAPVSHAMPSAIVPPQQSAPPPMAMFPWEDEKAWSQVRAALSGGAGTSSPGSSYKEPYVSEDSGPRRASRSPSPPARRRSPVTRLFRRLKGLPHWDDEMGGYQVMVGQLHRRVTRSDLRDLFRRYGEVTDVRLVSKSNAGFAFVSMKRMEEVEEAGSELAGKRLCGQCINIEWARPRGGRSRQLSPRSRSPSRRRRSRSRSRTPSPRRPSRYSSSRSPSPADRHRNAEKTSASEIGSPAQKFLFSSESPASPEAASSSRLDDPRLFRPVSGPDFGATPGKSFRPAFLDGHMTGPVIPDAASRSGAGLAGTSSGHPVMIGVDPRRSYSADSGGRVEYNSSPFPQSEDPIQPMSRDPSCRKRLFSEVMDGEMKPGLTKQPETVCPGINERLNLLANPEREGVRTDNTLDKTPRLYRALVQGQRDREAKPPVDLIALKFAAEVPPAITAGNSFVPGSFRGPSNLPTMSCDAPAQTRPAEFTAPVQTSAGRGQIDVDAARVKRLMEKAKISAAEAFVLYTKNRSLYEKLGLNMDD